MCGLTGFWQDPAPRDDMERIACSMADRIAHRGPDDSGVWADERTGLVLALAGTAQAQSLTELYQAARGFDAAYLSARAGRVRALPRSAKRCADAAQCRAVW